MKSKSKKTMLISILLVAIVVLSYSLLGSINQKKAANPRVEEEMFEVLPNGQSKVVNALDGLDVETNKWFSEKELELKLVIAQQTNLESENVSVVLASISNIEDTAIQDISCSVVLDTESTFEEKIINRVIEDITGILKQKSSDVNVSKENIVIMNSNNDVLY